MKGNKATKASLGYGSYAQFAHGQTYVAMPFSADISVEGLPTWSYGQSLSYQIREAIDSIAYDVLTQGHATRLFCLTDTQNRDFPHFLIVECSRKENLEKSLIASKKVVVKSSNFGIKQREVKSMVRKISHAQMPHAGNDFIRRNDLRDMMADRAGRIVFWTLSDSSKFTDPYILIRHCNQMILAIKICKYVESAINTFLTEEEVNASVTVPTYSLANLSKSLKEFVEGRISVNDFSDIVFSRNS